MNNPKRCYAGCGTVFELSPPAPGTSAWPISVLTAFTGYAGEDPSFGLAVDSRGPIFGLTDYTAFELVPLASGSGPWTQTVLYGFGPPTGVRDSFRKGPMTEDTAGNLYGTIVSGRGNGSVFELLNAP